MITPDNHFCDLMISSSCFGKEACPLPPCACAQSVIDRAIAMVMWRLTDHYWDSFEPDKALILQHVREAINASALSQAHREVEKP